METTTASVEANAVKKDIIENICNVSNLTGLVFLNSSGQVARNPSSIDNKDRTKYLAYLRLSCTLDTAGMDDRVKQESFCLGFCLKLP